MESADAADSMDGRGTEGIDFFGLWFHGRRAAGGLLNGLVAESVVAGACNRRYLQLWSGAA